MNKYYRILKIFVVMLFIFSVFAQASAVFLPHHHGCCEDECIACTILEVGKSFVALFVVCLSILGLSILGGYIGSKNAFLPSLIKNTPVRLRDKLSN